LSIAFFFAALLYSSVGHGGASGYLAVLALANFAPVQMRPIALLMNVAVASIAWCNFTRAGYFNFRMFWPLALLGVPCAYIGGLNRLSDATYASVLGISLILSAFWLLSPWLLNLAPAVATARELPKTLALPLGAFIGGLAGLTGIGGGIFLSPVLMLARYADAKNSAAIASGFILLNSCAGLAAQHAQLPNLAQQTPTWVFCAAVGGMIGSGLGAFKLSLDWLKVLLAIVLLIAAVKLL
jgi:uncharacterized protein